MDKQIMNDYIDKNHLDLVKYIEFDIWDTLLDTVKIENVPENKKDICLKFKKTSFKLDEIILFNQHLSVD